MNLGQSSGKSGVVIFKTRQAGIFEGSKIRFTEDVGVVVSELLMWREVLLFEGGLEGGSTEFRRFKISGIAFIQLYVRANHELASFQLFEALS